MYTLLSFPMAECRIILFQIQNMDVSSVEYLMNHEFSVPFTVGHTAKEVYWCVSKYSSITLIITDVKHLVE
jgi:hypothetical protein